MLGTVDIRAEILAADGLEKVDVDGDFAASKIKSPKHQFREKIEGYPETINEFTSMDFAYLFRLLSIQYGNENYILSLTRDAACFSRCMREHDLSKDDLYRLLNFVFSKKQKRVPLRDLRPTLFVSKMMYSFLKDMEGKETHYARKIETTDDEWSGVLKKARSGAYN